MAGLRREDIVDLSSEDLASKLAEAGLPKTLTRALEAKNIKGSTLLLFQQEDIKYELEELSTEDRMYLRNFLREIRKSDELFQSVPEVRYSPPLSPHSSLSSASQSSRRSFGFSPASSSSTPDTYYLRSSEDGEGGSSEELSESQVYTQRETHQQRFKPRLPGIATYVPLDLPESFELPNNFGKKVNKSLSECKAYGSMPQDVMKTFLRQVTEHIEAENPHPSVKTIEWVAWKYCSLYPGLKQANPVESLQKPDEWNGARSTFKEWGLLSNKIQRALENRRYQAKRKLETVSSDFKKPKSSSNEETHTVNDTAALSRHTKRLQEELTKTTPDLAIVKDLMDAEFFARRQWIIKLDIRTRVRETKAKYPILGAGDQLEEELVRILKCEKKLTKITGVEVLLKAWKCQCEKLKKFLAERFSLAKDEATDDALVNNLQHLFPTKVHKKKTGQATAIFAFSADEERPTDFHPTEPYLLLHSGKDDQAYTVMVGDQTYNSVDRGDQDSLWHAIIQLLALFYVYHLEYPQQLRNLYYYLQQFVLGDHDLCSTVRVVNSYHEAIQPYLVFANSM